MKRSLDKPARHHKTLLAAGRGLLDRIEEAELSLIAAGIAFFGFFALFPALAAVIALWGFASDPAVIRDQVALLRDLLPQSAYDLVVEQVNAMLLANSRHLGWATLLSTSLALWSARAGVAALIRGLNAIHGLPNRDGFWHLLRAIVLTMVLMALSLAATLAALVNPVIIGLLPLGRFEALAAELGNLLLGLVAVILGMALLYRFGPNRGLGKRQPPIFTRGLLLALLLWLAVSRGFVFYLANFGAYNQIYGSIGAVVALMMWLYLSAYAVLLGAAIDAERADQ